MILLIFIDFLLVASTLAGSCHTGFSVDTVCCDTSELMSCKICGEGGGQCSGTCSYDAPSCGLATTCADQLTPNLNVADGAVYAFQQGSGMVDIFHGMTYEHFFTHLEQSSCPIVACTLKSQPSPTPPCDSTPSIGFSFDADFSLKIDTSQIVHRETLCIWCRNSGSSDNAIYFSKSATFSVSVSDGPCAPKIQSASASVSSSITTTSYTYISTDGTSRPSQSFPKYVEAQGCPISGYEVYEQKTDSLVHPRLSIDSSSPTSDFKLQIKNEVDYNSAATYNFYIKILVGTTDYVWYSSASGVETFSFEVLPDCDDFLIKEGASIPNVQYVLPDSSEATVFELDHYSPVGCGEMELKLFKAGWPGGFFAHNDLEVVTLPDKTMVQPLDISKEDVYVFNVKVFVGSASSYFQTKKVLVVGCPSTDYITLEYESYAGEERDRVQYVSMSSPEYKIKPVSSGVSTCPVTIEDSSENGSLRPTNEFSAINYNEDNLPFIIPEPVVEKTYNFYLRYSTSGTNKVWSQRLTLHVGCSPPGITITLGSFPGDLTYDQQVDPGSASDTKFELPEFEVSVPTCEPTVEFTPGYPDQVQLLIQKQESNGLYVVVPVDISRQARYSFSVRVTGGDQIVETPVYTLEVGCSPDAVFLDALQTIQTVYYQMGTDVEVLSFSLPSIQNSLCQITETRISSPMINGVSDSSAVYFAPGCLQPCTSALSSSLSNPGGLSFKIITVVIPGVLEHESPLIQIQPQCGSFTSISTQIGNQIHEFQYGASESMMVFQKSDFQCNLLQCCNLSFSLSATDSGPPTPASNRLQLVVTIDEIIVTVLTSIQETTDFYVQAENLEGKLAYSGKITVDVVLNCSLFPPVQSHEGPSEEEIHQLKRFPGVHLRYKKQSDLSYVPEVQVAAGAAAASIEIDLAWRFNFSNAACPLVGLEVVRVEPALEAGRFEADGFTLKILSLDSPLPKTRVFVRASNGVVKSSVYLALKASEVASKVELPPVPPTFILSDLEPRNVSISRRDSSMMTIQLPDTFDFNQDDVTVSVANLQPFMSFDQEAKSIQVDLSEVKEPFADSLEVILTDSAGYSSIYRQEIVVTIEDEDEPEASQEDEAIAEAAGEMAQDKPAFYTPQSSEKETLNLGARIDSIDALGLVTIKLNSSINGDPVLRKLSPGNTKIFIQPSSPREEESEKLAIANWKVLEAHRHVIEIKLNFSYPLSISPEPEQDTLVIEFNEEARNLIFSPDLDRSLHPAFKKVRRKIRKQMPDTAFTRSFQDGAEVGEASLLWVIVVVFVLDYLLAGGMIYMLLLVRFLQIVLHLPIMTVIIPANLSALFSIILPVATFDVLDPEWTTELVFEFDEAKQDELQDRLLDQMVDLGYETHNSMLNLGSLAIFLGVYGIKVLIFLTAIRFQAPKLRAMAKKMRETLFFGELLGLLIDAYFEFLIAGYLQIRAPLTSTGGEAASVLVGSIGVVLVLGFMPYGFFRILKQPLPSLQDPEFKQRWGSLYEGINLRSKWEVAYYPLFAARRIVYVSLSLAMKRTQSLQVLGLVIIGLAQAIYVGSLRPLQGRTLNRLELFLEWSALTIVTSMSWFTDWLPNEETKYLFAWAPIVLLCLASVICLSFVLFFGVRAFALVYLRLKTLLHLRFALNKLAPQLKTSSSSKYAVDEVADSPDTGIVQIFAHQPQDGAPSPVRAAQDQGDAVVFPEEFNRSQSLRSKKRAQQKFEDTPFDDLMKENSPQPEILDKPSRLKKRRASRGHRSHLSRQLRKPLQEIEETKEELSSNPSEEQQQVNEHLSLWKYDLEPKQANLSSLPLRTEGDQEGMLSAQEQREQEQPLTREERAALSRVKGIMNSLAFEFNNG